MTLRVGIGGPVGSGKTALLEALLTAAVERVIVGGTPQLLEHLAQNLADAVLADPRASVEQVVTEVASWHVARGGETIFR